MERLIWAFTVPQITRMLTNKNVIWGRKDKNHIIIGTPGFKTERHNELIELLTKHAFIAVDTTYLEPYNYSWAISKHKVLRQDQFAAVQALFIPSTDFTWTIFKHN